MADEEAKKEGVTGRSPYLGHSRGALRSRDLQEAIVLCHDMKKDVMHAKDVARGGLPFGRVRGGLH